jgi:hypothetical protein
VLINYLISRSRQAGRQAGSVAALPNLDAVTSYPIYIYIRVEVEHHAIRSDRVSFSENSSRDEQHVRSAYQPPASSTFLSEQISHQQSASITFLSEQISTMHQPPAKRRGRRELGV